jgi:hypothetical protein
MSNNDSDDDATITISSSEEELVDLEAAEPHDRARKRKLKQQNPPKPDSKNPSKRTNQRKNDPKKVSPYDRVREFKGEGFQVRKNELWCG